MSVTSVLCFCIRVRSVLSEIVYLKTWIKKNKFHMSLCPKNGAWVRKESQPLACWERAVRCQDCELGVLFIRCTECRLMWLLQNAAMNMKQTNHVRVYVLSRDLFYPSSSHFQTHPGRSHPFLWPQGPSTGTWLPKAYHTFWMPGRPLTFTCS